MNPEKLRAMAWAPAGDSDSGGDTGQTSALTEAKQKITTTARETASRVRSAASETASRAKDEAQRLAAAQKENTANRIGSYSSAMHESAKSLEQQDPNIAWATHRAADRIQGLADYVRQSDFGALRGDAENFARRHPAAFFGGMFIAGLVLGNLMKARPTSETEDEDSSDWDAGNASGSASPGEIPAASGI